MSVARSNYHPEFRALDDVPTEVISTLAPGTMAEKRFMKNCGILLGVGLQQCIRVNSILVLLERSRSEERVVILNVVGDDVLAEQSFLLTENFPGVAQWSQPIVAVVPPNYANSFRQQMVGVPL